MKNPGRYREVAIIERCRYREVAVSEFNCITSTHLCLVNKSSVFDCQLIIFVSYFCFVQKTEVAVNNSQTSLKRKLSKMQSFFVCVFVCHNIVFFPLNFS